ncbi:MAG TPA: (E)-4-hydroxy-3-methylbut-2-enyl-diphosphate synthase [Opitutaceae bacterium]|nr:(E)-4-hydroxy-3-methylbut-2-enyl-diphosphate synthase [Opitutaceae bacterium]
MSYCPSRFRTVRRRTLEVKVGAVGVGGTNPVRLQSMTTSDTQDVAATVRQSIALAEVGCEIVRITAPNVAAAKCLREIRARFTAAGFGHVPLVADIHFLPSAAMEAVEHVEKVRVNPGNYADKKKFAVHEYTDADYDRELQRLHDAFSPLVLRAKTLGRSLRIGTNHGSLSDRIMNRYGDTPLGMVESALEFLRIAESHGFRQTILSMKASNPKVMIQAYRLLVERMQQEDMHYPLHLGVTEAGDGEDGRIKSAIGIGSLLLDGLGDTIRVSLTEDSVYEIPVARAIADKAMSLWAGEPNVQRPTSNVQRSTVDPRSSDSNASRSAAADLNVERWTSDVGRSESATADSIDPFHFTRRETASLALGGDVTAGPEQPPRVIVSAGSAARLPEVLSQLANPRLKDTPAEGVLVPVAAAEDLAQLPLAPAAPFLALELPATLPLADLKAQAARLRPRTVLARAFGAGEAAVLAAFAQFAHEHELVLAAEIAPADFAALGDTLRQLGGMDLVFTLRQRGTSAAHAVGAYRQLAEELRRLGSRAPIWIRNTAATAVRGDNSFLSRLLEASFLTGSLLCDGVGDLVSLETEPDPLRATKLAYNILQGAGARISKTEFVACPSCGRTLFDLQTTTQRIREKTGHLRGVKIAIMGCIVNGPGEMADADFGYVGGAPGKINLYVGKQCVQYNLPQAEADARLIALIKAHGKWADPAPVPA